MICGTRHIKRPGGWLTGSGTTLAPALGSSQEFLEQVVLGGLRQDVLDV